MPQDALCYLGTLPERRPSTNNGSSDFYLQNSEPREISFLYKVSVLRCFTIVTKALRDSGRHPQQAGSDKTPESSPAAL